MKEDYRFTAEVYLSLRRYAVKDWRNLDDEDKQTNEDALNYPDDLYLLAAYETCKGKTWIITNRISENAGDNAQRYVSQVKDNIADRVDCLEI